MKKKRENQIKKQQNNRNELHEEKEKEKISSKISNHFTKHKKILLAASTIFILIIIAITITQIYEASIKKIEKSNQLAISKTQQLKEYAIKNKELETQIEQDKAKHQDELKKIETDYSTIIRDKEQELNQLSEEYMNQLNEAAKGKNMSVELSDFISSFDNELIDDINQVIFKSRHSFKINSSGYLYLADTIIIDDTIYMVITSLENKQLMIYCMSLSDKTEQIPNLIYLFSTESEIGEPVFSISNENQLTCVVENQVIYIDSIKKEYLYTKQYGLSNEVAFSKNEKSKLVLDRSLKLNLLNSQGVFNIYSGYSQEDRSRGSGYYIDYPGHFQFSPNGEYSSFYTFGYEWNNGPYIIGNKGERVYTPYDLGGDYLSGFWISNTQYLVYQNIFEKPHVTILDFDKKNRTTLMDSQINFAFANSENGIFCVSGSYEDNDTNTIYLYKNTDLTKSIVLKLKNITEGSRVLLYERDIYVTNLINGAIYVDHYSYESNDFLVRKISSSPILITDKYNFLSEALYVDKTVKNNERIVYFKVNDTIGLIPIDKINKTLSVQNELHIDAYPGIDIAVVGYNKMIDLSTGLEFKKELLTKAIGKQSYNILAADVGNDKVSYMIEYMEVGQHKVQVYILKTNQSDFIRVDEFLVPENQYHKDDWYMTFPNGEQLYYDYYNSLDEQWQIKILKSSNELTLVDYIDFANAPITFAFNGPITYYQIDEQVFKLVDIKDDNKVIASSVYPFYPLSGYEQYGYYQMIQDDNGKSWCLVSGVDTKELARYDITGNQVLNVEKFGPMVRLNLIKWTENEDVIQEKVDLIID